MSVGSIILLICTVLIVFGIGQRVLDHLRLNDKAAVIIMIAMLLGSLAPDIKLLNNFYINISGAIIPVILAIYLLIKAGTVKEKVRSLIAALLTATFIWVFDRFMPSEPKEMFINMNYLYGIIGGLIAYVLGRSRRAAFVAGTLGIILIDMFNAFYNYRQGIQSTIRIGGAGVADAVVVSGFLALILAEFLGELIERLQGGTKKKEMHFENGEFVNRLLSEKKKGRNIHGKHHKH